MRILISGSRTWDDAETIYAYMQRLLRHDGLVIVHGMCPEGADKIADDFCINYHVPTERYAAQWVIHGRSAGTRRNIEMLQTSPRGLLAFIRGNSPGTSHCIREAKKRGIPIKVVEYDSHH